MADVPFRHRPQPPRRLAAGPISRPWAPDRPLVLLVAAFLLAIAVGGLIRSVIDAYHDAMEVTGLTTDTTPVKLKIAGEKLMVPANMLRTASARRGGTMEQVDLALYWPGLKGYSEQLESAFRDDGPSAPIVYVTIQSRDGTLDSTGRLDEVYSRFFVDKPLPGPAGLVGRRLSADSGYGDEVVYFMPSDQHPFVARCLADTATGLPATCLRDVNVGHGLSLLYRFNRDLLGEWQILDAAILKLAGTFLAG